MSAYDELMQKQAAFTTTPGYMEKQAWGFSGLKRMLLRQAAKARRAWRSYRDDAQELGQKFMDGNYKVSDSLEFARKHPIATGAAEIATATALPYGAVKAVNYMTGGDEEEQPTPAPAAAAAAAKPAAAPVPPPPDADPMAKQSAYNALMHADQVLNTTPGYMEKQSFSFLKNLGRRAIDFVDDKLVSAMARRPKTVATMAAMPKMT